MKRKKLCLVTLVLALSITLFPMAHTAADDPPPPLEPDCNPVARGLAEWMDVNCTDLMGLQADGVGFGIIMKAFLLSQTFDGLDWEDLVERHTSEEGLGWGQVMKAYTLANLLGLDAEELLAQHSEGIGWGEILKEHREGPGKPPWASQGPPPWARQGNPSKVERGRGKKK